MSNANDVVNVVPVVTVVTVETDIMYLSGTAINSSDPNPIYFSHALALAPPEPDLFTLQESQQAPPRASTSASTSASSTKSTVSVVNTTPSAPPVAPILRTPAPSATFLYADRYRTRDDENDIFPQYYDRPYQRRHHHCHDEPQCCVIL
jgi:hypothetical protein